MGLYRAMSSANSDIVLLGETLWTTSLMKIRNSNKPRTEPCGTPEIIDNSGVGTGGGARGPLAPPML